VRDIHALVDPQSQADAKFQTPLAYTRMTVRDRVAPGGFPPRAPTDPNVRN
jgi:hypothetical protein